MQIAQPRLGQSLDLDQSDLIFLLVGERLVDRRLLETLAPETDLRSKILVLRVCLLVSRHRTRRCGSNSSGA